MLNVSLNTPHLSLMGELYASCQIRKFAGCELTGNTGNVLPQPLVSDPGMHRARPGAYATHNFTYLVRGPWWKWPFDNRTQINLVNIGGLNVADKVYLQMFQRSHDRLIFIMEIHTWKTVFIRCPSVEKVHLKCNQSEPSYLFWSGCVFTGPQGCRSTFTSVPLNSF